MVTPRFALGEEAYNVKDFRVFGVSLGFEADDVVIGLTDYFYISREDLIISTTQPGNAVNRIEYFSDELEFSAYLEPKYPLDSAPEGENPDVLVKFDVIWGFGEKNIVESFFVFTEELYVNYGAPSSLSFTTSEWCEKLDQDRIYCAQYVDKLSIHRLKDHMRGLLVDDFEIKDYERN